MVGFGNASPLSRRVLSASDSWRHCGTNRLQTGAPVIGMLGGLWLRNLERMTERSAPGRDNEELVLVGRAANKIFSIPVGVDRLLSPLADCADRFVPPFRDIAEAL